VDKDVQAASPLVNFFHRFLCGRPIGQIHHRGEGFASLGLNVIHDAFGSFGVKVHYYHRGAPAREQMGTRLTDSGRASRHNRELPRKVHDRIH